MIIFDYDEEEEDIGNIIMTMKLEYSSDEEVKQLARRKLTINLRIRIIFLRNSYNYFVICYIFCSIVIFYAETSKKIINS